jgi:hypothetical protein
MGGRSRRQNLESRRKFVLPFGREPLERHERVLQSLVHAISISWRRFGAKPADHEA